MIVTTTSLVEGRPIIEYKGLVATQAILGANAFADLMANLRDFFGGRAGGYERILQKARDDAMRQLQAQAEKLGANAVIGIDFDYNSLGQNGSILMVSVSGTAVVV
jgi:uncharacterized protein YbjQ (UPF0145 family)